MDLLIKWPTRGRPALFQQTFERWQRPDVRFVISLDADDPTWEAVAEYLTPFPNVRVALGVSTTKVEAINADLEDECFDLLILAADDVVPVMPNWRAEVERLFDIYCPDGDGLLHLPDGRRRDLITIPIMGYAYYRRFGYIYHPAYKSVWCDNEQQCEAQRLGRYHFHHQVLFKHEWIGPARDATYIRNEAFGRRDAITFQSRRAKGFPLKDSQNE